MQEFNLGKKFILIMKGCLVVFVGFLILGIALPFIPEDGNGKADGTLILSTICTIVFGFFTIMTWQTLKKLPYVDIVIDNDGLWYKHKQKKDGLVPWEKIHRMKERGYLQCLDIQDSDGRKLIRIEYQLNDFETLRRTLSDKLAQLSPKSQRTHFSKHVLYHFFYAACIIIFSWLGLYVGRNDNPWLGYIGMSVLVIIILYEYLSTAYKIGITDTGLTIAYPAKTKTISYSDVLNIEMADTFQKGSRFPEVWVTVKNTKKAYKLKQLGIDANILYITLKKAVDQKSAL